jgi:hypothetical protein
MSEQDDRPFRWEDLDQRLIKPELQLLTDKMQKRAVDGKRRVVLESSRSGNAGSYFPLFFDFQEQLADEWVQGLYTLYRDAPNRQNRSVTPAFIRAVWDRGIFPFIGTRTAAVLGELSLDVARTRRVRDAVAEGSWVRRMRRFATRWRDKLEGEAVKWEYRLSRREGERQQQSRDRVAIREMDTEQASQGVLTCKKRLEEVTALLNAKTQALGQMDAKGDRKARRRTPITQAIRALSNQKATLEWHFNEYNQRLGELVNGASGQSAKDGSRRSRRLIDERKVLIASLKARNRDTRARKICELIDNQIEKEPRAVYRLIPLQSWVKKASGLRTWTEFYDNKPTRNLVRAYVNKVPPLETRAKTSK